MSCYTLKTRKPKGRSFIMSLFKSFKSVTYCVAQWADRISEEELRKEADWLQKYVGIDKVYLETFRGSFARREQILMIKKVLAEYGIEVSGGITTVTPDLNESDKKRHRLLSSLCPLLCVILAFLFQIISLSRLFYQFFCIEYCCL